MIVSLTPQLEEIIRKKIESGHYQSAAQVLRDALWLLDASDSARDGALAKLRTDVEAGWRDIEAGRVTDFDPDATKRRGRALLERWLSSDEQ